MDVFGVALPPRRSRAPRSRFRADPALCFWCCVVPIVAIACSIVTWPVLSAPNDVFPYGVDTVGHLTRIEYLANRWMHLQFSDWFPEWYGGATLVQYYPPLSLWTGAVIQLITRNIMVTFKAFMWICMFSGGLCAARLSLQLGGDVNAGIVTGILYPLGHFNDDCVRRWNAGHGS